MHLYHIPQCTTQNINVHFGICDIGLILGWVLFPFVCALHYLTIIIMHIYRTALNTYNAFQYILSCVCLS